MKFSHYIVHILLYSTNYQEAMTKRGVRIFVRFAYIYMAQKINAKCHIG
jgi:hypothetical protein